jgi:hypothetical protein
MIRLFALSGFPENNPIAMLPSCVVGRFPLRINDWPLANFNDAIARQKSNFPRRID